MKRYTLEELKAMSDSELHEHWLRGKFPFESLSRCGTCLTGHSFDYTVSCDHTTFAAAVRSGIGGNHSVATAADLRPWLEEIYALRLFFDPLYPQPVSEPSLPPKETTQAEESSHTPSFRR